MTNEYKIRKAPKKGYVIYDSNQNVEAAFSTIVEALDYIREGLEAK